MFGNARADLDLGKATSSDIFGRRCGGCQCDLDWIHYRRDSSQWDGHAVLCFDCEQAPKLSTAEHTSQLRELNNSSHAVKKQQWAFQDEYKCDEARVGRPMHYSAFINVLGRMIPNLYFMDGRVEGDLAVFKTYPGPQTRLGGRDFEYLWYVPKIVMPEYSQYEFDEVRDIPIKERVRGWRTPLLRCILGGLISEEQANTVFGPAVGTASSVWHRKLQGHRNRL